MDMDTFLGLILSTKVSVVPKTLWAELTGRCL